MTTRILPSEEWAKLVGTEAESAVPFFAENRTFPVVVESDGQIVGCHVLMWVLHAECLWIHPDHRGKSSVARRLWSAVRGVVRAIGAPSIMTAACDDTVRDLLAHVGAERLPGDHYVVLVKG